MRYSFLAFGTAAEDCTFHSSLFFILYFSSRKLSTYATWWIRQAIGRGIADEGRIIGLPVHVHERLNRQRTVRTRLTHDLGREPSREELAAALAISLPQLAHLERIQQDASSLNAKVRHTDNPTELGDLIPDQRGDSEADAIAASVRRDLTEAMQRRLTDREQRFVRAYFGFTTGEKPSLEAIARHEGLTRERVRQVIAEALAKLRADPLIASYAPSDKT